MPLAFSPGLRVESLPETYAETALRYANDVVSGVQVACKWVKLACQRHITDLQRFGTEPNGASPYYFDDWWAEDICSFAEKLPHVEGKWDSPTFVLEPWQIFCLSVMFGWRRTDGGNRRFRKCYWELGRKNGKSTIAAVIGLYCLTCEGENSPYIFVGATTGAQAQKVFHPMRQIVLRTPALQEAFGLHAWAKSITEAGGGYIQTINSKASNQDGHNPHLCILDELHAHAERGLYDVMDSAMGARRNPMLFLITTAGFSTEGVCYEQRRFGTQVLESVVEADHVFCVIFTLDDADDPFDSSCWIKANPNLGVSVQLENMEAAAIEAKAQPGKLFEFKTKRLNVWTSARSGHVNITKWRECDGEVNLAELRGVECWGGLDLANTSDLAALRLIWMVDGRLKTWGLRYLPIEVVGPRSTRNSVPYARWQSMPVIGHDSTDPAIATHLQHRKLLTCTEGDVTDLSFIEADILWAHSTFNIQTIGFDSWNAGGTAQRMIDQGVPMTEVRQGFASLTAPVKTLDRFYLGGKLDHAGDEILTWCASNVVARRDANGNEIPGKQVSSEKIDDFAALIDALAVANIKPEAESRYNNPETREMVWL